MAKTLKNTVANSKKRIISFDQHPIIRYGLQTLLEPETDLEFCGGFGHVSDAVNKIEQLKPDLVITGITFERSSSLDLVKEVHAKFPRLPILVLTMRDEAFYVERFFRVGAKGYVVKSEPSKNILEAVRKVLKGEVYVSEEMAKKLVTRALSNAPKVVVDQLDDRELKIFGLIGHAMPMHEIARETHLSLKAIENYTASIRKKLHLRNFIELAGAAIQWVAFQG